MAYLLSPKGELLLFLSKQQGKLILNDSFKIFENYEDLMEIIYEVNAQNENIFKFIYFYEQNIHHVLYEFDKIININNFKLKMNFAELFYLDLLISDNVEIVNYTYNFELLINIFQLFNKKYKIGKDYKIALASNILLNLINNYCGTDNYNESINGEEINKMKNELENEINNNLDEFNKLLNISEENIKKLKIDDLYCKIVISLIKSNNLNDFNSLNNIFKEIELDKINIENKILPSLQEAFEENNEFMEKFIIKTEEDFDEKKINFYFILFKFILKSEFYIYQIPLLLKMKKIIIELIKSNKFKNDNNKFSKEIKDRLRYVLEIFAGSKYYFELNKEEINKLKTVLIYFKSFYFETKIPVALIKWLDKIDILSDMRTNLRHKLLNGLNDYYMQLSNNKIFSHIIYESACDWCFFAIKYIHGYREKEDFLITMLVNRQPQTFFNAYLNAELAENITEALYEHTPILLTSVENCLKAYGRPNSKEDVIEFVRKSALFHDIGINLVSKIEGIQYRTLFDQEMDVIKLHPTLVNDILEGGLAIYRDPIMGHHKYFDQSAGYPEDVDMTNSQLRIVCDILAVCDTLNSATDYLGRTYKQPKDFSIVLSEFLLYRIS